MTEPNRPQAADVAVYADLIKSAYAYGVIAQKLVSTANGLADRTVDLDTAISYAEAAQGMLGENRDAMDRIRQEAAEPLHASSYPGLAAALERLAAPISTYAEQLDRDQAGEVVIYCAECGEGLAVRGVLDGAMQHEPGGHHTWVPATQPERRQRVRRPAVTTTVREG